MSKTKKIEKKVVIDEVSKAPTALSVPEPKVLPLTQEFGNGDLNILRDKINELIKINN